MKTLLLLFMLTQHKIDIPTRTDTLHYQVMTLDSLLIWWDDYEKSVRYVPVPDSTWHKREKVQKWMEHLRQVLDK